MQRTASSSSCMSSSPLGRSVESRFEDILSRSSPLPRVRRRAEKSAVMVSSGGSEDNEPVGVDFWGEPFLLNDRVFLSARPDVLEVVEEC